MKPITSEMVKELRHRTGVGMFKCKQALEESQGDLDQAIDYLRKAGMASAIKKESREAKEGKIVLAETNKVIALVEVNCETDFVANNASFHTFADRITQEFASLNSPSLEEFLLHSCSFDPKLTIDSYRSSLMQALGENIQIRRIDALNKQPGSSYGTYSHAGGKIVTVVELSGDEKGANLSLSKNLAMHVAAETPTYLSQEQIPSKVLDHERDIAKAQIKGKPDHIIEKIVSGKIQAFYDQVCLLNQKYVKNSDLTIRQLLEQEAKKQTLSLSIRQFIRWQVGEFLALA